MSDTPKQFLEFSLLEAEVAQAVGESRKLVREVRFLLKQIQLSAKRKKGKR
jgi:hypothetical protein